MAKKVIITIGREFGSEGHEIGRQLAENLDIAMYDRDLLTIAAKKSGIAVETLAGADEKVAGRFLEPYLPMGIEQGTLNDKLFGIQSSVILDIAAKESCVIVGRCADYILRDTPNCINVFIYAPFDDRVKIISEKHKMGLDKAKKLVKRMDNVRNTYYTYYADRNWNTKEGKDILLNRSTFGIDGCVSILETMVRKMMEE